MTDSVAKEPAVIDPSTPLLNELLLLLDELMLLLLDELLLDELLLPKWRECPFGSTVLPATSLMGEEVVEVGLDLVNKSFEELLLLVSADKEEEEEEEEDNDEAGFSCRGGSMVLHSRLSRCFSLCNVNVFLF
jgi:hypothetical protein